MSVFPETRLPRYVTPAPANGRLASSWGRALCRGAKAIGSDTAGNVLTLWAFFLIPLLAVVGSGVDIGRAYLARTHLQEACDAAALAGRRAMTASTVDAAVKAEALKFFNFNFPQLVFGTTAFVPQVTSATGSAQTVVITAATTMPTTIMTLFGYASLPVAVTCNASQDFVNTDIVLVLDTTGSMDDKASSTDTNTKIVGLRNAVLALYDQLAPVQSKLEASGLRLRYGIVPYASTVNVGAALMSASPNYMYQGKWGYQSRQISTFTTYSLSTCNSYKGSYNYLTRVCTYFSYDEILRDTTDFVNGKSVDIAPLIGTADSSGYYPVSQTSKYVTWKGCTEERQTTQMSSTATAIPTGAYDLDIDLIPNSDETKWKPYLSEIEYAPYEVGLNPGEPYKPQYACPTAAVPMKAWDRAGMNKYLNTLDPDGGTYHDFGMMWGARWASAGGVFGPNNPNIYNGMPVKKYIIFMTDGLFGTSYDRLYSGYGVEKLDARITPGGNSSNASDQLARHKTRFNLLCSKAKTMGYSVWVIGFATSLDASLTNCASNSSQASTSSNSSDLIDKFVEIGKNIGALRLTQ
jgi:Flp pilus assembly protein TadG